MSIRRVTICQVEHQLAEKILGTGRNYVQRTAIDRSTISTIEECQIPVDRWVVFVALAVAAVGMGVVTHLRLRACFRRAPTTELDLRREQDSRDSGQPIIYLRRIPPHSSSLNLICH